MRHTRGWLGAACAAVAMASAPGCGGSSPVNLETAKVSGSVKLHGFPMKGGQIVFIPSNTAPGAGASRTAPIKPDGTFEITTLAGRNSVRVSGPQTKKEPLLSYATKTVDVEPSGSTAQLDFP